MVDELHELVKDCLRGDQTAARLFVQRYQQRVFGLCWRMLGHRQDAEDAAQETFIRALRSLERWNPARPLEPWLLAIAANRCRSALARRQQRPSAGPLLEQDVGQPPDELHAARQLAEELRRALDRLRPEYAQAFCLLHEEQFTYDEIAAAFDRPVGTIKTWVHRARRHIIEQLEARGIIHTTSMAPNNAVSHRRTTTQRIAG